MYTLRAAEFQLAFFFLLCVITYSFSGCTSNDHEEEVTEDAYRSESTVRMALRLEYLHRRPDPENNPFANSSRIHYILSQSPPSDPVNHAYYQTQLAREFLHAGRTRDAIDLFHRIENNIKSNRNVYPDELFHLVKKMLAISYLRLGEQENCIHHHTTESCIVPIAEGAVHINSEGSRKAIEYYTELLEEDPEDFNSRWLLNVAYMTLGKYPQDVPERWLIPVDAFKSEYPLNNFHDIAADLGINVLGLAGGAITEDFTGSGYLDILVSSWGLGDQIRFFVNNGDGTFTDRTEEAGLTGITGGLNMVHADYTNNGYPDVFVLRGAWMEADGKHPNSLLRNNGGGTFTDVTEEAGVLSFRPTQTAAWGDFNNNGWVDLFIGNESTPGNILPSELYVNNGDGTFTNIAPEVGLDIVGYVKGVVWGDYNNDGYLDLYISKLGELNLLFRNNGPDAQGNWSFTEVAEQAGVTEPLHSFPVWFFDYNNNGWLDIFVSGYYNDYGDVAREYLGLPIIGEYPRLYENNGDGTFSDVTERTNLKKVLYTMGCNFGDLDNDGYLDFYAGTGDPDYRSLMPNRMFRNADGEYFQEVTTSGGFGHIQKGHGVAFADINNNGMQDVYMTIGGALEGDVYWNALFKNPGNDNNWITLYLEGVQSNRSAIGTRIKITVTTEEGIREIYRTVSSGGSFGGSSFRQEIGLGNAAGIEKIEILWPISSLKQTFTNVEMNNFIEIREGEDRILPVEINTFTYTTK